MLSRKALFAPRPNIGDARGIDDKGKRCASFTHVVNFWKLGVVGAAEAHITPQRLPFWVTTVMQNRLSGCILCPGWLVGRLVGFDLMQVRDHTHFTDRVAHQAPSQGGGQLGSLKVCRKDVNQAKCRSWFVRPQQRWAEEIWPGYVTEDDTCTLKLIASRGLLAFICRDGKRRLLAHFMISPFPNGVQAHR